MGETQRYAIPYKGLKPGCHEFRFEVDGSLFEEYQSTEIKDGRCDVTVGADRSESRIVLDVAITGYVIVECDRCLEDWVLSLQATRRKWRILQAGFFLS